MDLPAASCLPSRPSARSASTRIRFRRSSTSIGYGRIEILTKPGTDKLHGRFYGQGNDNVFNTGNPFTAELPSYYSYQYNGTLSGALSKWASFFLSVEDRETQTDNVYSILGGPLCNGNLVANTCPTTYSVNSGSVSGSLFSPANRLEVSPRIDLQLGQKNTLTLRYQFFRNNVSDSLGGTSAGGGTAGGTTSLPSLASSSNTIEHTVQLDDTELISDRLVNETRIEYRRSNTSSSPASTAPGFGVPGVFSGGGNGNQFTNSHMDHYEFAELHHFDQGHAGHQIRRLAARRPRGHHNQRKFQRQLQLSLRHGLCRHMERRRQWRNDSGDRRGLPSPIKPVDACPPSSPTPPGRWRFRATCLTRRFLSRTIGR